MKSQTSLVASQVRLQSWATQIRECQNRPSDMSVDQWCEQQGITKANYYYRFRRVRESCLEAYENSNETFVELPAPIPQSDSEGSVPNTSTNGFAAILRMPNGITIELQNNASVGFLTNLFGVISNA